MKVRITHIPNKVKSFENGGQQDKNVDFTRLLTDATTGVPQKEYEDGKHPEVNSEVEVGEFILYPDGKISEVLGNEHGDSNKQGGSGEKMQLPEGARIISDNVLVSKEDVKKYKEMGFSASTKNTYADVYRVMRKKVGITELNEEQAGRMEDLKDNDDVQDDNTKKVNEEFLSKHINELEKKKEELKPLEKFFGDITYNWQEKAKKSKDVKKESESDFDGENISFNGGKIPIVKGEDGGYYTTDKKNLEPFKKWAKKKGFKTTEEVTQYLAGGLVEDPQGNRMVNENGGKKKLNYYELGGEELDAYIEQLIKFEGSRGSAKGTGLDIAGFTGGKATTKEELKKLINDQYLSEVKKEVGDNYSKLSNSMILELLDYKFNTGRNVGDLLSYAEGAIGLDEINSNKSFGAPQAINISVDKLRQAKDDVYKTTKGGTLEKPSAAYTNSWQHRVNYLANPDEQPEYRGLLKAPTSEYLKDTDTFEDKSATALGYVPTGQHKAKTGTYGRVTQEEADRLKKENPWYDKEINPAEKGSVLAFQKAFNDRTDAAGLGRKLKEDDKLGEQTSTARIPWLRPKTEETTPTATPVDNTKPLDPYKPIGDAFGGFGVFDELPYVPTPFMRNLPSFNAPQYQRISPIKVSPEDAIAEAARQGRLATQSTELGAGRPANLANIQRITSEISSEAVSNAEKQNAQLAYQANVFNLGQQAQEESGRINAIGRYEPDAQNRFMLNHEDWGSYYQQGYENRQANLNAMRERQIYQSMSPNYLYDPWGNINVNRRNEIPLADPNFGYLYGNGQFNGQNGNNSDGTNHWLMDKQSVQKYKQWLAQQENNS